jgi:predicted ribosome quality control (RQC) complex YloA/Tae2 family protein
VLSLAELSRAVRVLEPRIAGHRLQRVVQPDANRVVLSTYGSAEARSERGHHVLLSCHPEMARLSLLERLPRAPAAPPVFAQYLRAHVVGARVAALRLLGEDRLVAVDLRSREGAVRLLLSLFGRRSNLYLFDAEERLVAALRPLEATRPELAFGEPWKSPASRPPRAGEDRFAGVSETELLEAIEETYAAAEAGSVHAERRHRVEHALRKEARRLDRKLEKLAAELEAARGASEFERHGELLKGVLSRVRRGDPEVVARDHATGEDVTIALDPTKSPAQNLDHLFRRYQKAVRRLAKGGAQQDAVREARRGLDTLEQELCDAAANEEALCAFSEQPAVSELLRRHARAEPGGRPRQRERREVKLGGHTVPRRLLPRRYRSAGDLEIWVGRSSAANDLLTTRLARGKDLFFHLDGAPGSHVILRTEGRPDPPSEAVLEACELAVHFSKFKNASRADVHVVPIKNVRKPKGAKPGLVTVHGGRTVHLRRTPKRLERILAAGIEEKDG